MRSGSGRILDDGTMKKIDLGNKYMDGSVLFTDDMYGSAIPEGEKGKILKYKVNNFDEEEDEFTLEYSSQTSKDNRLVWIEFPIDESLMHAASVEMMK